MAKKILLVLVLFALAAGLVFSQEDFSEMGKNTITLDLGPTIVGGIFAGIGEALGGADTGISSWGFGMGIQYERQLLKSLSVAGRFNYLGGGLGFRDSSSDLSTSLGIDIHSFSIEGHVRFYPGGGTFFLDGMAGYAYMGITFSGNVVGESVGGGPTSAAVSMKAERGFFLVGGKLGWRIKFGSRKWGFTFEPSLGYAYGFSGDDTIWTQVAKKVRSETGENVADDDIDEMINLIQDLVFVGGPRIGLAIGWRF